MGRNPLRDWAKGNRLLKMAKSYHILNGEALHSQLTSVLPEPMFAFNECLIEGPVSEMSSDEFFKSRLGYLAREYGDEVFRRYAELNDNLSGLSLLTAGESLYLWFEEDLFCQTNFWFVAYYLIHIEAPCTVFWVKPRSLSRYGFGGYAPSELAGLYAEAVPIDIEKIAPLWVAYAGGDFELLRRNALELGTISEHVVPAIDALIESKPKSGVGRPLATMIDILKMRPEQSFAEAFNTFQEREPIYGYGDVQVKRLFDEATLTL